MPGIGEASPVRLQLDRDNFNALIGRHSQPIRWLVAEKCPCIKNNLKVDESCPICSGKGVSYDTPTQSIKIETLTAPIDGVIEKENVLWVKDFSGNEYEITSKDCVAYVTGVLKGRQYQVSYIEDVSKSGSGTAVYIDDKLYKIDLPVPVDFGSVQASLLTVTAKLELDDTPLTVSNIFRNCFEISETILPGDVVSVSYEYVDPFSFVLIHNNLSKSDQKFLTDISGDSLMVFPQRWDVYEKDIIVALNSTLIKKVNIRSTGVIDTLPSFYIYELKSAWTIRSNVKYEFTPGTDFVLYKGNQIKWIGDAPLENEQISITYSYNSVYRVMGDIPDPRTSEDNRFPRKVALKLYTDFNSREEF